MRRARLRPAFREARMGRTGGRAGRPPAPRSGMSDIVSTRTSDGVLIADIQGEIDMANVAEVQEALRAATVGSRAIVIDLTRVVYLDSAALAMIHHLWVELGDDLRLRLVTADASFSRRVLAISGLDSVIPIDRSVEEAEAHLRRDAPDRNTT
jgi:anti-anti-sigma factor